LHKLFSEKNGDCANGAFGGVNAAVWCAGEFLKIKKALRGVPKGFLCSMSEEFWLL